METTEGPWRRGVRVLRAALRREAPPRLPARALVADMVLAVMLTAAAMYAVATVQDGADSRSARLAESLSLAEPAADRAPTGPPSVAGPRSAPQRPRPPAEPPPVRSPGPVDDGPPVLLVVLTALPLASRRRYPLTTFWTVLLAALAAYQGATWITVLTCAIAAYSAVAHSRDRVVAVAGLLLAAVLAGVAFRDVVPSLPSWLGPFVVLLTAGVFSSVVRFWRQRLRDSRERVAELQRTQREAMRRAVEEERSRIAAELHDVVTHNVSVMVIQAGAARAMIDLAPAESRRALLAVEAGGRAAMAELRNVMGLLAGPESERPGDGTGLEPQPGLGQIDALVERVRAAGVPVQVVVSPPEPPEPPGLPEPPPGVELAAYRVVQEALTNTIKHAPGATASVAVGRRRDRLEVEVTDTGAAPGVPGRPAGPALSGLAPHSSGVSRGWGSPAGPGVAGLGRGLIGLRERLSVYGGTLDAGPAPGGGFRVRATIPWRSR
ncbi:sensor histidine kinase [Sphaerisporangium rufum]|uniref:sensor histidine kinase n=1 Tax=Sphaerisporangium rufum TaxID=1381558 RepID=UPI0023B29B47|nr:histidine kinase [Sphaerisporangium rufum]